jgi:hypothetical protein
VLAVVTTGVETDLEGDVREAAARESRRALLAFFG